MVISLACAVEVDYRIQPLGRDDGVCRGAGSSPSPRRTKSWTWRALAAPIARALDDNLTTEVRTARLPTGPVARCGFIDRRRRVAPVGVSDRCHLHLHGGCPFSYDCSSSDN